MRHKPGPQARLISVATGLDGVPALAVTEAQAGLIRNGRAVPVSKSLDHGADAWASLDGAPVAIGSVKGGIFHLARALNLIGADGV